METIKLDMGKVRAVVKEGVKRGKGGWGIETLQTVIFVAVGGGMLGRLYSEKPADAYIDDRVTRLPYSRAAIENIRKVLVITAEEYGLDPHNLPPMPAFHCCGVF